MVTRPSSTSAPVLSPGNSMYRKLSTTPRPAGRNKKSRSLIFPETKIFVRGVFVSKQRRHHVRRQPCRIEWKTCGPASVDDSDIVRLPGSGLGISLVAFAALYRFASHAALD